MKAKGRHRIHGAISDVVTIELWMLQELDVPNEVVEDCFMRIQARMLVVQSILWPDEADVQDPEWGQYPEEEPHE